MKNQNAIAIAIHKTDKDKARGFIFSSSAYELIVPIADIQRPSSGAVPRSGDVDWSELLDVALIG
jgi:hypothetical protein